MIRQLPFYDKVTTFEVAGERAPVYPFQIVRWISLAVRGVLSPLLPTLLDTGVEFGKCLPW